MGIALLQFGGLIARLQGFANRLKAPPPRPAPSGGASPTECVQTGALAFTPMHSAKLCAARQRPAHKRRPAVHVVRVLEGCSELAVGRIVISGRLADVCAELDRLAELEAAAH